MQIATGKTQAKPFIPLNLSGIKLPCDSICRGYRDNGGNTLFELCTRFNVPFMAFLFKRFPEKGFSWKRECFAKLLSSNSEEGFSSTDIQRLVPVQNVTSLPQYEMWPIYSSFGEDLFWAAPLLVEVQPEDDGSRILISQPDNVLCAEFFYPHAPSDSEFVLTMSLRLRNALHIQKAIRICSVMERRRLVWYLSYAYDEKKQNEKMCS